MLLSRSLTSSTLNFSCTSALSSTWPLCSKKPTPELNNTTRFKGRLAAAAGWRVPLVTNGFSAATKRAAGVAAGANPAARTVAALAPAATLAVVRGAALPDSGGWLSDVAPQ